MAELKPCIYKHTCGFDICNLTDCPYYEPKSKGRKWFEETFKETFGEEIDFDYGAED